jgi:quercetin dioxygenase-like cupin family protein
MHVIRTRPDSHPGPAERFTGTVWIDSITAAAPSSRIRAASVHFAPGARTAWHHHPRGQILYVVEGLGRVQQRGRPIEEVRAGDTILTAPGEWHWHGAALGSFMTHIAIHEPDDDDIDAYWGDLVTDDEYRAISVAHDT